MEWSDTIPCVNYRSEKESFWLNEEDALGSNSSHSHRNIKYMTPPITDSGFTTQTTKEGNIGKLSKYHIAIIMRELGLNIASNINI